MKQFSRKKTKIIIVIINGFYEFNYNWLIKNFHKVFN